MDSEYWFILIISLVIFNFLFSTILEYVNDKNWKTIIPLNLKEYYNKEKYIKAKEYKIERGKISFISSSISFVFTLFLLWFEGFGIISEFTLKYSNSSFAHSGLFISVFFIINFIIGLPFSYYSTFYIEEKFGFNKTTIKTFILDKIKGIFLSILIGGFLLFGAMFLFDKLENGFWLWLWIALSFFIILLNMFYADIIVPIFNKLTPLEDGTLRKKIEEYSKEVGYSLKNIFVIDGSKRSSKANAFFSGIGPKKTIALYDTLIEKHSEDELVAVLAHEVGHYKKKHVLFSMILSIIQLGIMCFLFELCMSQDFISQALGSERMYFHLGLIGFSFLYSPIGLFIGVLLNILSRKNEFEADEYAKETSDGNSLQLALKKLSVDSLSNLYPHPFYVFIHYSHPPLLSRLEALEK